MQEQLDNLQRQIDELKIQLSSSGMSSDLREVIKNEVVTDDLAINQATTTVTMSLGGNITFPTPLTRVLVIRNRGKAYKVPYYV